DYIGSELPKPNRETAPMPAPIRPRRSVLFMPGSNPRALEKARALPADALIFDLEDAVAPEAKETARTAIAAAVSAGGYAPRELVLRVNPIDTVWGHADLATAATSIPPTPRGLPPPAVRAASSGLTARPCSTRIRSRPPMRSLRPPSRRSRAPAGSSLPTRQQTPPARAPPVSKAA